MSFTKKDLEGSSILKKIDESCEDRAICFFKRKREDLSNFVYSLWPYYDTDNKQRELAKQLDDILLSMKDNIIPSYKIGTFSVLHRLIMNELDKTIDAVTKKT